MRSMPPACASRSARAPWWRAITTTALATSMALPPPSPMTPSQAAERYCSTDWSTSSSTGFPCTRSKISWLVPASFSTDTTASKAGEARRPGSVTTSGLRTPVSSRQAGRRRMAARPKTILVGNENVVISSNMLCSGLLFFRPFRPLIFSPHFDSIDQGEPNQDSGECFRRQLIRRHDEYDTNKRGVAERDEIDGGSPAAEGPFGQHGPCKAAYAGAQSQSDRNDVSEVQGHRAE